MTQPHPDFFHGAVIPAVSRPFGATWDGVGTGFRIWSANATAIALELRTPDGGSARIPMAQEGAGIWHAYVPGVGPGTRYGLRVDGPFLPAAGHLFNPAKLLLDPYARLIDGPLRWHDSLRGYHRTATGDLHLDTRDSAADLPWAVVTDTAFDWQGDAAPRVPWRETVIYEAHLKGLTELHPEVPRALRGTYLGLASEPVVAHLKSLGVTAVELLPIHQAADNDQQARHGLTNYWGYATIGFFAPEARYARRAGAQVDEFREMVRRLHAAGIEVILDVVYNHTGEGGLTGPTVSFRGLDNASWYRQAHPSSGQYEDFTGCGNTLDVRHPLVHRFVLDSLRYWVTEMHVDGFRFDLAPAIARDGHGFDPGAPVFRELASDPAFAHVKLIAEPWDLGPDGYRLGQFPPGWAEWNGKYRDAVRRFWRGAGGLAELAARVTGSGDVYEIAGRPPEASVNFLTCHDGFTLADLVAYERKHNEANAEQNRDGSDWNESRNWGVEGPTDVRRTLARRDRVRRSLMATLALSLGVPMLSHGDELGRSQQGNNNAYCHDSPLTWVDWTPATERDEFLAFVRRVFELRRSAPLLTRGAFLPFDDGPDAPWRWLTPGGEPLTHADWMDAGRHTVVALLRPDVQGASPASAPAMGERWWLLALNGGGRSHSVVPPRLPGVTRWRRLVDTAEPTLEGAVTDEGVRLAPHALVLLEASVG
jgi:glycogen operon protein